MQVTAVVTREHELYVAQCAEVDVASQGSSVDEALANLREALELYFEDAAPQNAPQIAIVRPIEVSIAGR
jgi:predicted RNase H-like HicB family nuclease